MEVWKDVPGYEGKYQVSSCGNVKSLKRQHPYNKCYVEKAMKPVKQRGYLYVMLWNDGSGKWKPIHRLVAEAFLYKPEGKQQVNHIDGNKHNNNLTNLEWVTASENVQHSFDVLGRKVYTRKVLCVETGEVFDSLKEVTAKLGIDYRHISSCCNGKRKKTGGFHWRYAD